MARRKGQHIIVSGTVEVGQAVKVEALADDLGAGEKWLKVEGQPGVEYSIAIVTRRGLRVEAEMVRKAKLVEGKE